MKNSNKQVNFPQLEIRNRKTRNINDVKIVI